MTGAVRALAIGWALRRAVHVVLIGVLAGTARKRVPGPAEVADRVRRTR
ncbi:hypothetical protein ACWDOR_05090 [Streptosporangium canum]